MKKIKWSLLVVALAGVVAAYANKRPAHSDPDFHTYAFWKYSDDGSRMYYTYDLTQIGYVSGNDYVCVQPGMACTFIASPGLAHLDPSGKYFYTSDVPTSGIITNSYFLDLNF